MNDRTLHPNTRSMINAWRRLSNPTEGSAALENAASEDLVSRLFVLVLTSEGTWTFRHTTETLGALLGKSLPDRNFSEFWSGHDKAIVGGVLESVAREQAPAIIRGRGETLLGRRVDLEISLAPLMRPGDDAPVNRLLGLYQTLGGEPMLEGRPVWRHTITEAYPAPRAASRPGLKIVVSNS
ncbi:MAG: PAS domain-containing protein [Pseudomonadota bacterium]